MNDVGCNRTVGGTNRDGHIVVSDNKTSGARDTDACCCIVRGGRNRSCSGQRGKIDGLSFDHGGTVDHEGGQTVVVAQRGNVHGEEIGSGRAIGSGNNYCHGVVTGVQASVARDGRPGSGILGGCRHRDRSAAIWQVDR